MADLWAPGPLAPDLAPHLVDVWMAPAPTRAEAERVLRNLLARYLGPGELELDRRGKPRVPGAAVRFNISHSGGIALFAFTLGREVGVDVERVRPRPRALALARRTFGDAEAARLERLDGREREREFLRLWVRHEAVVKCTGEGIGGSTDGSFTHVELDLGDELVAALALPGDSGPHRLRRFRYRPDTRPVRAR